MSLTFIALLSIAFLAGIYLIVRVFRSGKKADVLVEFPFGRALFWAFGFQLLSFVLDWLISTDNAKAFDDRMGLAALLFAICATIWLIGFFVGRRELETPS